MLPEWIIGICKKKFSCTRERVIDRVKEEDEISLNLNISIDLSM